MNERLLELRKALGLTQAKFGEKLKLKSNTITNYEKGNRSLNDRVIADICREYNVNETWLREGTGSMFRPVKSDESLFAEQAAKLIKSKDPVTIKAVAFLLKLINDGEDELKDAYIKFIHDSHKAIMEMEEYKNK